LSSQILGLGSGYGALSRHASMDLWRAGGGDSAALVDHLPDKGNIIDSSVAICHIQALTKPK
jgi:hypothetical protein